MQQPSTHSRNVTQGDPVIMQGQIYPQGFNQPTTFHQNNKVNPRPLYGPNMAGNNPELSSSVSAYPGVIQYSGGMSKQQIMGMSSNTSRARVESPNMGAHIGSVDNTNSHSISFQFSSIGNPNNMSTSSSIDPENSSSTEYSLAAAVKQTTPDRNVNRIHHNPSFAPSSEQQVSITILNIALALPFIKLNLVILYN